MNIQSVPHPSGHTTGIRWKILLLLCGASFIAYVLRTNMSIAGDTIIKTLGLTQIQLGMIFSAFAWGYAIFQFPGGVFGDILGTRKAITIIAIFWGLLTIVTGIVPGPGFASPFMILAFLMAARFLVGMTHAPFFPLFGGAVANWFPVGRWGLPNGLGSTALTLGAAAAAPLIVWLIHVAGWRMSFILTAPLGFVIAGLWWWYARDYPAEHKSVSQEELDLIDANRPPASAPVEDKGAWKLVLKNREVFLLTLSYFCMNYVFYLFFNWFFFYLVDVRGASDQEAAIFTSAQWIVGAVGATVGGFLCDSLALKLGARWGYRALPVPSLILSGVFLLLGANTVEPTLAVILLSISFGCTQLTEGSFWAAIASVSGRHTAAASGVLNTGGNVVNGVAALMVPILANSFGWVIAVGSGAVFAFVGAGLWFLVRADRPMLVSETQD